MSVYRHSQLCHITASALHHLYTQQIWGGAILTPTNSFLHFGVLTSVPILGEIDQEMRPWECPQMDTQIQWQTDRHKPVL